MNLGAIIIENRFDVRDIVKRHAEYLTSDWQIVHVNNPNIKTMKDYNTVLTMRKFWEDIPYDKVLIFQHDSGLISYGIDEFLQWDYIGAPWKFQEHGGNGGLSIRSCEAMLWCIDQKPWNESLGNEDVYFSNLLLNSPFKLAPREECEKFSVESIYKENTIGYHAIDKYLTPHQVKKILTQYE